MGPKRKARPHAARPRKRTLRARLRNKWIAARAELIRKQQLDAALCADTDSKAGELVSDTTADLLGCLEARVLEASQQGDSAPSSQPAPDAANSSSENLPLVQPKNEIDFGEESAEVFPSFGFVDVSSTANFNIVPKREPIDAEEELLDDPSPSTLGEFSSTPAFGLVEPKVEGMAFEEEFVQAPPPPSDFSSFENSELEASRIEILRVESVPRSTFAMAPEEAESQEEDVLPSAQSEDLPEQVVETIPRDPMQQPGTQLTGRRIVDIAHFTEIMLKLGEHSLMCTFGRYEYQREIRKGLLCTLVFCCKACKRIFHVTTTSLTKKDELNDSFVLGTSAAGIGFSQVKDFMRTMDIPVMTSETFQKCKRKVSQQFGASLPNVPPLKTMKNV